MSSQHQSGAPMKLWISTWAVSREATAQPKLFPHAGGVALMARVFAAAERSLRQIDQFDYLVRRWLIPIRHRLCTPLASNQERPTSGGSILGTIASGASYHAQKQALVRQ